jgi:LmbE family N-acetylglucosaminyl deacetylase
MRLNQETAEIFIPDGLSAEQALARTTHMAVSAHQDDIEIMAAEPILQCFQQEDKWFTGVVMTDGRGSPRDDLYKTYTDNAMCKVRNKEQKKAAVVGEYAAQILLDYSSKAIKDGKDPRATDDLVTLFRSARPQFVYTHALTDKHDTHVGTALKVITAIRSLPKAERPQKLFGCEVWRGLDWMVDSDKVPFDLSAHENIQSALLGVFDSQIAGGKRYDIATLGRRRANATYFESHGLDTNLGLAFAMDLTPLLLDPQKQIQDFVQAYLDRFSQEVSDRFSRLV